MKVPTLTHEKNLFSRGLNTVAGIDEAGRGAWAGPLVAAVIVISPDELRLFQRIRPIRDSKLLSALQRRRAYNFLIQNFSWNFGAVESVGIDASGLTFANQEVMNRALGKLNRIPEYILVDGRGFQFSIPYKNIIDGDAKVKCISAASILAKVTRDTIMNEYDEKFPRYGFSKNKGYGTKFHIQALYRFGICPIHRKSYKPIQKLLRE